MPYHYKWLQEKRVLYCCVYGAQDFEETTESQEILSGYLDDGTYPTHYLADLRHFTTLPSSNIRAIYQNISFARHPHLGWIVTIESRNPMITYVLGFVAKLFSVRYKSVQTPQEAIDWLQNIDRTIHITADLDELSEQIRSGEIEV